MKDTETIQAISALTMAYIHLIKELEDAGAISSKNIIEILNRQLSSTKINEQSQAIFTCIVNSLNNEPQDIEKLMH